MADVKVQKVEQVGDSVVIAGTVDGVAVLTSAPAVRMEAYYPPEAYWPADAPDVREDQDPNVVEFHDGHTEEIESYTMRRVAGHLRDDAEPRPMTEDERSTWWAELLAANASTVLFSAEG